MRRWRGNVVLLITALVWGFAFVAQSTAMDYVGPFTFQSVRSILGAAVLVLYLAVRNFRHSKQWKPGEKRRLVIGGICCGTMLCIASCLQQIGIQYTTVGKAGVITTMYVLLVPIFGLFLHRRSPEQVWICVVIAAIGLYLLSMSGSFRLSRGDTFVALCAVCFAVHILVVDHFAAGVDGVELSCVQFLVSGLLAAIPMAAVEQPTLQVLETAWLPIAYAGVMSCGVGYTLQIVGQRYAEPTTATLIMSLESVFAVVGGILLLHQIPTPREAVGCLLMFAAVIYAQLPTRPRKKEKSHEE